MRLLNLFVCLLLSVPQSLHAQAAAEGDTIAKTPAQSDLPEFLAAEEPPLNTSKLQDGKVILRFTKIDDDIQRVRGWVLINAERALVWAVLIDCDQAIHYVPDMRECEVRASGKDESGHAYDLTYHRVKPYFFLPAVDNLFRATYLPPEQIHFRKAGGDLVHFQGRWQFHAPAERQTLLHYDAEVDLRASVNVRGERRMIRKDVGEMLGRLKRLSERYADKPEQHR